MTSPSPTPTLAAGERWRSRRWAAWTLRAIIFSAPWAAAVATSLWLAPRIFVPRGAPAVVAWWLLLVTASSAVAWAVDRGARRLLPLTAMLAMTLVFPDRAPSRFRVALRNSDLGELRRRVAAARAEGGSEEAAGLMLSLANALNRYDRRLRGHGERTRAYADMLAVEMRIPSPARDRLRWAALLHDIGKIEIPAEILAKDGPLEPEERAIVRRHPLTGMRVAAPLVPWLGEWSRAIEDHHEWWDGSGYPRGLRGEEISLGARIVAVADAFDVMTSGRSYQPARHPEAARREISRMAGIQFDPAVVRALMNVSLGKLRWMIGPVTWMGQIPFFLDRLGRDVVTVTSAAAITAATIVGSVSYPSAVPEGIWAMEQPRSADTTTTSQAPPSADDRPSSRVPSRPVPFLAGESTPLPPSGDTLPPPSSSTTSTTDPGTATDGPPERSAGDDPAPSPAPTTSTTLPPPNSHDDVASTQEDRPLTIDVLANDTGVLTLAGIPAPPSSGDASIASGRIRYTPDPNFHGTDTFGYRACDQSGRCDRATVAVRVAPVNDSPSARDDAASTESGRTVTIDVLHNDRDVDGDRLTVRSVGGASGGRAGTDGSSVTYTSHPDFHGTDSFAYRTCDPSGGCDEALVTVTVERVPRAPVAVDDTAHYHPGGKEGSVDVLANDRHPDGLPLGSVRIVQPPSRGEIVDVAGGRVTYRMEKGTTVPDSFVYRVCDRRDLCDTATVSLSKGP